MISNAFILFLVAVVMTAKGGSAAELDPAKCYIKVPCSNDATEGGSDKQADSLTASETLVVKLMNSAIEKGTAPEALEALVTKQVNSNMGKTSHCPKPSAASTTKAKCEKGMSELGLEPRIPVQVMNSQEALCDTVTDGGGWIIIQRRINGDVDFYRNWIDYKSGFGTITTDYWLGLENIYRLTSKDKCELRVDLTYQGNSYYALYSTFKLGNVAEEYKLTVDGYSGTAKDSLKYHNNHPFATHDHGSIGSITCATLWHGAWWYYNCQASNLNGEWASTTHSGLEWYGLVSPGSVSSSEMKIRLV